MLRTFFSVYLQCLLLISLFSAASVLQQQQQQQYAAAIDLSQSIHITPVHANTSDLLANNGEVSNTDGTAQNSSTISQKQEQSTTAVKNFQNTFCGIDGATVNPNTNGYITEHTLPQSCEMPLGIAVERDAQRVWYVSTKRGVL